jgi:predicted alpha/beta superfamily hydrolase
LDIHHIESRALETTRRITVLRPRRRYGATSEGFPVLYLNDGQNLFDPLRAFAGVTWNVQETVNRLARKRLIPPLVVVGIDHGGAQRNREYLPAEDPGNPYSRVPLGRKYAEFVINEVMPFVERNYPVARGPANTGFGGSSYGAVAALYTTLMHPGTFGRLLLESPSLYVANRFMLRKARAAMRWPARIYLGVGTTETNREQVNRETVENVWRLESILRGSGFGPRRLKVVVEDGGRHSEGDWARRLPDAIRFLFG